MGTVFTKDATFRNKSYLPGDWASYTAISGATDCGTRYSVFYPNGTAPEGGWPVLVYFICTNFADSVEQYSDNSSETVTNANGEEIIYAALMAGRAVVIPQVSAYNASTVALTSGETTLNLAHAPGGVNRFYEGGTQAAITSNGGKAFHNAYNNAVLAVQYIKFHATELQINKEDTVYGGTSGGAAIACWVGFAPNRAGELGTGGQYDENTVPNAMLIEDTALLYIAHYATTVPIAHLPTTETGFTQAATLNVAAPRYIDEFSIWSHLPGFTNDHVPPFVWHSGDATCDDKQFSEPFRTNITTSTNKHDPWPGLVLRNRFPGKGKVFIHTTAAALTGIAPLAGETTRLFDGIINDIGANVLANDNVRGSYFDAIFRASVRPRWDTVLPRGGIRRRGQVETVGRVITPRSNTRGGVLVHCRTGGSGIRVGDEAGNGCTHVIQPGEKAWIPLASHLHARSESGIAYFETRELERDPS